MRSLRNEKWNWVGKDNETETETKGWEEEKYLRQGQEQVERHQTEGVRHVVRKGKIVCCYVIGLLVTELFFKCVH